MKAKENKETKKLIKYVISCSVVGIGLAFIFANPIIFNICSQNYTYGLDSCLGYNNESVPPFLFLFSIACIFFSIILLFLRDQVFYTWFHFAIIYLPAAIGFILYTTKSYSGGGWISIIANETQFVGFVTFSFFFLISLILIAWGWWKTRKAKA